MPIQQRSPFVQPVSAGPDDAVLRATTSAVTPPAFTYIVKASRFSGVDVDWILLLIANLVYSLAKKRKMLERRTSLLMRWPHIEQARPQSVIASLRLDCRKAALTLDKVLPQDLRSPNKVPASQIRGRAHADPYANSESCLNSPVLSPSFSVGMPSLSSKVNWRLVNGVCSG